MHRFDPVRLRELRLAAGLSQTELAAGAGKSYPTVRFYELGRITPPGNVVGALADVLGCSVADLYTGDGVAA